MSEEQEMSAVSHDERVGVVGLGAIGLPVAINLARAGFAPKVWNRTAAVTSAAVAEGAEAAELEAMGRACSIVLTVLPDLPEVEEVVLAGLRKGFIAQNAARSAGDVRQPLLVVMGTVSPTRVETFAEALAADGVLVVDAPVSGGDVGAQRGELSIMAGGAPEAVSRVAAVLDPACGTVRRLGGVGAGSLAKACNQMVVGATLTVLSEALLLGRAGGLGDDALLDVLAAGLAGSTALDVKREKWTSGDFTPGGRARFQLKDLGFALEAGDDHGLPMALTRQVEMLFDRLIERGGGDLDHAAVITVLDQPDDAPA